MARKGFKNFKDPALITEQEVADLTGFHINKIREFRRANEISHFRFPSLTGGHGHIRYAREDVEAFKKKWRREVGSLPIDDQKNAAQKNGSSNGDGTG
jgi:predicted alpha/beta hydrolase